MGEHARKKDSNNQKALSSRTWKKGEEIPIGDRIAALETSLRIQREEQARIARVEELRAQVNAGTYKVDSKAIAQKMLKSPEAMKLLGLGKEDLFALKDEE
jgi:flagellar biosynthesis anti-sigma factor FlgM